MVTVRVGGDKDKIAGAGFNKMRRLADERNGRAASGIFTRLRHAQIKSADSFLALQGTGGI